MRRIKVLFSDIGGTRRGEGTYKKDRGRQPGEGVIRGRKRKEEIWGFIGKD